MNPNDITLSDIKVAMDIAKPIIDTFVKPKLEELASYFKRNQQKHTSGNSEHFEECIQDYLANCYQKNSILNVLVLPNQQIPLKKLYYPLDIFCEKTRDQFTVNELNVGILNLYKKILIADSAGMGKSTIIKFLCIDCIEKAHAIPVIIDLRNLTETVTILDEIINQLTPIDKVFEKELLLQFIEKGNFLFLFDGFDEIQQRNQSIIVRDIKDFISKTSNNWFIMTSRPETGLSAFGDFQVFKIMSLTNQKAYDILKVYDTLSGYELYDRLLNDVKKKLEQLASFLQNPFLVSLLYKTYSYSKDLPATKSSFYEEVYLALFKDHDISKDYFKREKFSKLDIQQFRMVLRQLAFETLKDNRVSYSNTDIVQYLTVVQSKTTGVIFNPNDFLQDLIKTVPLFVNDGLKVRWAHKSFQDFFSAEYLAFDSFKDQKLAQIYQHQKKNYLYCLDLFQEIDPKTFRKVFIRMILEEFLLRYSKIYNHPYPVDEASISLRKSIMAYNEFVFILHYPNSNFEKSHFKALKIARKKNINVALGGSGSPKSGAAHSQNWLKQMIRLLANKEPSLFEMCGPYHRDKIAEVFPEGVYEITDDPNEWFNSKEYFNKVNDFLKDPNIIAGIGLLSIPKSQQMLDLIINEDELQNQEALEV